jgi:hypothetical protein
VFLPIITSRELVDVHLATYETWLMYLQKIIEHTEPFVPALTKASTYITVHYRNGIHVIIDVWRRPISDTPLLNGVHPCLTYSQCGTPTYGKTWRHTDATMGSLWIRSHPSLTWLSCGTTTYGKTWWDINAVWVPIRIRPIHPSKDFPVAPPCMAKCDELVWLCKK